MYSKNKFKNHYESFYNNTVPEYRTIPENRVIFEENKKRKLPFIAVEKNCEQGTICYDFITILYQLNENALNKVKNLFETMAIMSNLHKLPYVFFTAEETSGKSYQVEINLCREFAPLVRNIILNPLNWVLSNEGKIQKAAIKGDYKEMVRLQTGVI